MIRLRGSVEFKDGTTVEFAAGSAAFVAWEGYARRHELEPYDGKNPNTLTNYVAYAALGVEEGFDVWMRDVLDVDVKQPEGANNTQAQPVDPTQPAPILG